MLSRVNNNYFILRLLYGPNSRIYPRNRILEFVLNPYLDLFTHKDRCATRRRQRQGKTLWYWTDQFPQHTVVGKCIRMKNRGIDTSYTIRNVITLFPFEFIFQLFSPLVFLVKIRNPLDKSKPFKYQRTTQYELRKRAPVKSKVKFTFYHLPEKRENLMGWHLY